MSPSRRSGLLLAAALAVAAGGAGAVLAGPGGSPTAVPAAAAADPVPVATPVLSVVGGPGRVPWDAPLQLAVADGELESLVVSDPDRRRVEGSLTATGWTSARTLVPAARYTALAAVRDAAGARRTLTLAVDTAPAERVVHAALSPGDERTVGVGQPVEVRLDLDVTDPASRAALEERLSVRTTPSQPGDWRWMDDRTLHYRSAEFWQPGTRLDVVADLHRLALPDGTWGSGRRTSSFAVGERVISTVDVQAKTMTVRRGDEVLRVMRASMGKPGFETRNGTFLVLEKHEHKVMDSSTLVMPPGEAAYRTGVDHAVRITNSGTFAHSAPWSVRDQGVRNVSHGCINLAPADAAWFYDLVRRGDVVEVVGSTVGPNSWDAGSRDWNVSWEEWQRS